MSIVAVGGKGEFNHSQVGWQDRNGGRHIGRGPVLENGRQFRDMLSLGREDI